MSNEGWDIDGPLPVATPAPTPAPNTVTNQNLHPQQHSTPAYDTPAYETPAYETPSHVTPSHGGPSYEGFPGYGNAGENIEGHPAAGEDTMGEGWDVDAPVAHAPAVPTGEQMLPEAGPLLPTVPYSGMSPQGEPAGTVSAGSSSSAGVPVTAEEEGWDVDAPVARPLTPAPAPAPVLVSTPAPVVELPLAREGDDARFEGSVGLPPAGSSPAPAGEDFEVAPSMPAVTTEENVTPPVAVSDSAPTSAPTVSPEEPHAALPAVLPAGEGHDAPTDSTQAGEQTEGDAWGSAEGEDQAYRAAVDSLVAEEWNSPEDSAAYDSPREAPQHSTSTDPTVAPIAPPSVPTTVPAAAPATPADREEEEEGELPLWARIVAPAADGDTDDDEGWDVMPPAGTSLPAAGWDALDDNEDDVTGDLDGDGAGESAEGLPANGTPRSIYLPVDPVLSAEDTAAARALPKQPGAKVDFDTAVVTEDGDWVANPRSSKGKAPAEKPEGRAPRQKKSNTIGGIRLTERDLKILAFLGRYRFATVGQLARRFQTSETALRNRLPLLNKAGLIAWWWAAQTKPKIWTITEEGLRTAGMTLKAPPKPAWGQLRHTLGLVDLGIQFELGGEVVLTEREIRAAATRFTPTKRLRSALALGGTLGVAALDDGDIVDFAEKVQRALIVPVPGRAIGHIPDMVLARQPFPNGSSGNIAIELELTRKGLAEWQKIVAAYLASPDFHEVYYFVDSGEVRRGFEGVVKALGAEHKVKVVKFVPVDLTADPTVSGGSA